MSAYLLGQEPPPLPPEQGRLGLTDADLYTAIVTEGGDPLGGLSFEDAVLQDPRRVDGLILQRVIGPFYLAVAKIRYPQMDVSRIQGAMRHAYLQRNHDLRMSGPGNVVSPSELARDYEKSWKANGEVLRVAFEMRTPAADTFKELLRANRGDIRRAFREASEIAMRASKVSHTQPAALAWAEIHAVLRNMSDMIEGYMVEGLGMEVIDDEILWIQPESMGFDLFGALSMDNDDDSLLPEDEFGLAALEMAIDMDLEEDDEDDFGFDDDDDDDFSGWQFEEHIVSGHRAPAVALSQYRRMGGRFY